MANRNKIVKIRLNDYYFDGGYASFYHKRENPIVLGRVTTDGSFRVQSNPEKRSYGWHVYSYHASVVQKPLILISVENEDTRKAEPQAQK